MTAADVDLWEMPHQDPSNLLQRRRPGNPDWERLEDRRGIGNRCLYVLDSIAVVVQETISVRWPEFNDKGDLPPGVYRASLAQVIGHFGQGTLRRRMMAQRLERIHTLAAGTGYLARFIVFGSFVTAKPDPGDVDVFMVMEDAFDLQRVSREEKVIFEHMPAHNYEGASVFWIRRSSILDSEQETVEHWQHKRDLTKRGIVEVLNS